MDGENLQKHFGIRLRILAICVARAQVKVVQTLNWHFQINASKIELNNVKGTREEKRKC